MKFNLLFIALFLFPISFWSQEEISIKLINAETSAPIPFATMVGKNKGWVSDQEGIFTVSKNRLIDGDSVEVRSVGYSSERFSSKKILIDKTIKLSPNRIHLKEVAIKATKYKKGKLGYKKFSWGNDGHNKFTGGVQLSDSTYPQIAILLPNNQKYNGVLKNISLYISKRSDSPIEINLHEAQTRNLFGKKINNEPLYLRSTKDKYWATIDLSTFNIAIPPEGIYVAINWDVGNIFQSQKLDTIYRDYSVKKNGIKHKQTKTISYKGVLLGTQSVEYPNLYQKLDNSWINTFEYFDSISKSKGYYYNSNITYSQPAIYANILYDKKEKRRERRKREKFLKRTVESFVSEQQQHTELNKYFSFEDLDTRTYPQNSIKELVESVLLCASDDDYIYFMYNLMAVTEEDITHFSELSEILNSKTKVNTIFDHVNIDDLEVLELVENTAKIRLKTSYLQAIKINNRWKLTFEAIEKK